MQSHLHVRPTGWIQICPGNDPVNRRDTQDDEGTPVSEKGHTTVVLKTHAVITLADTILAFIRAHSGEDIRCIASYGLAVTGIDSEGRLHAFMFVPEDQTREETLVLREQCQELLPTK
jgi:hypothetical protein